jgi:hypothetical protein
VTRGQRLPGERPQSAVALNLVRHLDQSREERSSSSEELAKLGTKPDWDIAVEIGRPVNGLRLKRTSWGLRIPAIVAGGSHAEKQITPCGLFGSVLVIVGGAL